MNPTVKTVTAAASSKDAAARVRTFDWERISLDLDAQGSAVIEGVLSPDECQALAELYPKDDIFRSRVVMERHGFGRGEYKYFSYPLPDPIAALRAAIYPHLVPIANRWNDAMGIAVRYPESTRTLLSAAIRPARSGRHRLCSSIGPMITIACTRTSMASMCFRSR